MGRILLLAGGVAGLNAFEPLILKHIFDELAGARQVRALAFGVGALILLGFSREAASGRSNWLMSRTRSSVHHSLLDETVSRLHKLPASFYWATGVGGIMTRLDRSLQGFVGAVSEIAFNVIPAIAYLSIAVFTMFRLDWRLACVVLVFAPLPGLIAGYVAPRQAERERTVLGSWVRIYSRFHEVLSGIVAVKSLALEDREKHRLLKDVHEVNQVVTRGVGFDARVGAIQNLIVMTARVAAVAFGGMRVLEGDITTGTLVAFLGYVGGLFGPVQNLTGIYRTLQTASAALDEVFSILDSDELMDDAPDAVELPRVRGDVTFEHVCVTDDCAGTLVEDLNMTVKAGETVAIVTPSGAGKATLLGLLQRFHDPNEGSIRIDGTDVRQLKQSSLRRQIGVLYQDALLFNESVRDNIASGKPHATTEEIEAAAKSAHAHDFIMRLPQAYATVVGERGRRLTSGERQRIAIARSLLMDPSVLILDEPTSALDTESEVLVQDAVRRLTKGRTTIALAHRVSPIVEADRVLVMQQGRVVETGAHTELVKRAGDDALWLQRQTQGVFTLPPENACGGAASR